MIYHHKNLFFYSYHNFVGRKSQPRFRHIRIASIIKKGVFLEEAVLSGKDRGCASPVAAESAKPWEIRMNGESPKAFNAFCFYRAMGYRRSIKACMELHGIEAKKYGSWARWARIFDWKNRAALYDEYIAKETERGLINEHVEHRKCFMAMIGKMAKVVDDSIGKLESKNINADTAMDLLERSARLDGYLCGDDDEKLKGNGGQLEIRFVEDFKGV